MSANTKVENIELFNVDYKELRQHFKMSVILDHPLFIWGATGIGKTSVVEQESAANDWGFLDLFLVARESVDFGGLPHVVDERMAFALPTMIPLRGDKLDHILVVFLDELPLANPMVQNVCYKLTLERRIGDSFVHDNVRFVAAGNRIKDKGSSSSLPAPLLNRFRHIELGIDVLGWLKYAETRLHPAIVTYIKDSQTSLHAMQKGDEHYTKAVKGRAFNTNRTWADASESLYYCEKEGLDKDFIRAVIASHIGSGCAMHFMGHYDLMSLVPSTQDIFDGVITTCGELSHAQQYYLVYNLVTNMKIKAGDLKSPDILKTGWYADYQGRSWDFINATCGKEIAATFLSLSIFSLNLPIVTGTAFQKEAFGNPAIVEYLNAVVRD